MSSGNGRGGGGGRERRGERTRAPLRWQFWRRKALLLVLCAGQSLPQQSLAFGFFTLPRGVNVALSSRSRLPSRGGHKGEQRCASVLGAFFPPCTNKSVAQIARFPARACCCTRVTPYCCRIVQSNMGSSKQRAVLLFASIPLSTYLSQSALSFQLAVPRSLQPIRSTRYSAFHSPTRPSPNRQTCAVPSAAVRGVAGCRTPARSRGKRTLLRAEFIEDEYARLVRRMARLERIVSGQAR